MEKSVIHILEIPGKKSSYYDNLILSYIVITLYFILCMRFTPHPYMYPRCDVWGTFLEDNQIEA